MELAPPLLSTSASASLQRFLSTLQRPEGALPLSAQLTLLDAHIDSLQQGLESLVEENGERIQSVEKRAVELEEKVDGLKREVGRLEQEAMDDELPSLASFKAAQSTHEANILLEVVLTALHSAHASIDALEGSLSTSIDAQLMAKLASVETACAAFEKPELKCAKGRATAELGRRREKVEELVKSELKEAWARAVRVELEEGTVEVQVAREVLVSSSASSPTSFADLLQALTSLSLLPPLLSQLSKQLSSAFEVLLAPSKTFTLSPSVETWSATPSGPTTGGDSLISLFDWFLPKFTREQAHQLGLTLLPSTLPQLLPHLRSTLPTRIDAPPTAPTLTAQLAHSLRRSIEPLLPAPSAASEDLLEEVDALTRFAQRVGKEWGRALAEGARREARALIMGGGDGQGGTDEWEAETIQIEVEVELQGLAVASAEGEGEKQEEGEDEWGWGAAAASEEANQALATSTASAAPRAASPAGSNGSNPSATASTAGPRRKGKAALGSVRVVKPADQLGSGPLPEEGADDAWGFDDESLDVPGTTSTTTVPPARTTSRVQLEEPADEAWFEEEPFAPLPTSTSTTSHAPSHSAAAASSFDPLAESMDEEEDVDEDAWGLTDEEREERAAKRASLRGGVPKGFTLPQNVASASAKPAAALGGLSEMEGEEEDPWEVDTPAAKVQQQASSSSEPPKVEVEDVDWDLNDAPSEREAPVSTPAPASALAAAAQTAPRATSPIALVEPVVDEEADGAWGLEEEEDDALPVPEAASSHVPAAAAAAEEVPLATPSAPLTEPAVAALDASSTSLKPSAPRAASVVSNTASTIVLPPTPSSERIDPVDQATAPEEAQVEAIEQVIPPPLEGSALPLTRGSSGPPSVAGSDKALPGTPVVEREAIEENLEVGLEKEAREKMVPSALVRVDSPITIVEPVDEEAEGAWGLEEEEEDALAAPEATQELASSGITLTPAAAEEEAPTAPPSAPLTEPAVAALGSLVPSAPTASSTTSLDVAASTAVLPRTPVSEREDSNEATTPTGETGIVELVIPPPSAGSALPLQRGSTGSSSIASAPGSDAAAPGTPVLERSPIAETASTPWSNLADQADERPSTPLVAPPIGGSALPTTRSASSTRAASIASAPGSDAAVPGTPVLERASLVDASSEADAAAEATWPSGASDRPSTPLVAPPIGGSALPSTRSASSTRPASVSSAAASDDALPPTTPEEEREEPVFDDHPSRVDTPDIPPPPAVAEEKTEAEEVDPWDSVVESGASEQVAASSSTREVPKAEAEAEEEDEWTAWAEEAASHEQLIVAPKPAAASQPARSAAVRSSSPLRPARVNSPLGAGGTARGTASPQLRQATLRSAVAAEQATAGSGVARTSSLTRGSVKTSSRSASPAAATAAAAPVESEKPTPATARKETCVISTRSRRLMALAKRVLSEAITLSDTLSTSSADANASSWPSAQTLALSVGEILDLHRALVPSVHARALQAPSLAAQFANDCAFVARETQVLHSVYTASSLARAQDDVEPLDLQASARATALLGRRVFDEQLELQASALDATLDDARGFDRTHEPEREKAVSRAVAQSVALLRQLAAAWQGVLPASARLAALGTLVEGVLARVLKDVAQLEDISEKESERLAEIVKAMGPLEELFVDPASGQTAVALFVPSWFKASYLSEILLGSLVDIEFLWAEAGALVDYTPAELASLIRALFADTPNRAKLLDRIGGAA